MPESLAKIINDSLFSVIEQDCSYNKSGDTSKEFDIIFILANQIRMNLTNIKIN